MALDSSVGGANAESYGTVAEADTYHSDRGNASWAALTAPQKEAALRRGTAFLEGKYRGRWKGSKASTTQALAWPRDCVRDEDGNEIADDVIPVVLKHACFEAALREGTTPGSLQPDVDGGPIKSISSQVGPLSESITYADGASPIPIRTVIENLLSGLVASSAHSFLLRA